MVPAGMYAIQGVAALMAYQNLDGLTFNILNQTKTLSAALCCYLVMGQRQSGPQITALLLLLLAAVVMEDTILVDFLLRRKIEGMNEEASEQDISPVAGYHSFQWEARHLTRGVAPILLASFLSGLAGAISQKSLQNAGRNSYLFSMELSAASVLLLQASFAFSPDGQQIMQHGFWQGWTRETLIPILTNSAGGVVVGLVTKYAGSVQKGFALIFGILLSGLIQAFLQPDVAITKEQILGGVLAAISLYVHTRNPPKGNPTISPRKGDSEVRDSGVRTRKCWHQRPYRRMNSGSMVDAIAGKHKEMQLSPYTSDCV